MENKQPSRKKLYLGMGVGTVLLLLLSCCCLGGVGGGFLYFAVGPGAYYLGDEKNPQVTKANYDALQSGMTLAEIEAKLGPGKPTSMAEVRAVYKSIPWGTTNYVQVTGAHERAMEKQANYRWRNGDDFIIVMFDRAAKDDGTAAAIIWAQTATAPPFHQQKGSFPTYRGSP